MPSRYLQLLQTTTKNSLVILKTELLSSVNKTSKRFISLKNSNSTGQCHHGPFQCFLKATVQRVPGRLLRLRLRLKTLARVDLQRHKRLSALSSLLKDHMVLGFLYFSMSYKSIMIWANGQNGKNVTPEQNLKHQDLSRLFCFMKNMVRPVLESW